MRRYTRGSPRCGRGLLVVVVGGGMGTAIWKTVWDWTTVKMGLALSASWWLQV